MRPTSGGSASPTVPRSPSTRCGRSTARTSSASPTTTCRSSSTVPTTCETSAQRVADGGRLGYCFQQNTAFETLLSDLGFAISRRHGHVWTDPDDQLGDALNHLILVASGLPTDDNPGGHWWVDVGLGDAFAEPLPLVRGEHVDDGFRFEIGAGYGAQAAGRPTGPAAWTFRHDPTGAFSGIVATSRPSDTGGDRGRARAAQHVARLAVPQGDRGAAARGRHDPHPARLPAARGHRRRQHHHRAHDVRRLARRLRPAGAVRRGRHRVGVAGPVDAHARGRTRRGTRRDAREPSGPACLAEGTPEDAGPLADLERDANLVGLAHVFGDLPVPLRRGADPVGARARGPRGGDRGGRRATTALRGLRGVRPRHRCATSPCTPTAWGPGIARDGVDRAVAAGVTRLWVLADNHRARGLYESLGWAPTGVTQECPWVPHPTELEYRLA